VGTADSQTVQEMVWTAHQPIAVPTCDGLCTD
jgi:hypothetical protein